MKKFRLRITGDIGFEIWQDIEGYEGYYQVSTYGRIKSVERVIYSNGGHYTKKESIKIPSFNKNYYQIKLYRDNSYTIDRVHRIVAKTFIPNTKNLPCVNHKDENTKNNRVENLEWCTWLYNNNYGTRKERVFKKIKI